MCLRLCCDPHKLTYIAAIFTACEAVLFGALNLTLILLSTCVIKPPDEPLGGGLDKFYSMYFFSNESCFDRYGPNFTIPEWVNTPYALYPRPLETSVESNLNYQISYLTLHAAWIISSFILLYGNARKKWGFYIPWLLICFTFTIMDVTIAAFFMMDMMDILKEGEYRGGLSDVSPMIWGFSMYLRIYLFWFSNLGHLATSLNAFCKTRRKRAKQERRRKKLEKKHERELAEVRAAAEAKAAAEAEGRAAAAAAAAHAEAMLMAQRTPPPPVNPYPPITNGSPGIQNRAYDDQYSPQSPLNTPPSHSPVPKEVRPFSYLNPSFRPSDSHDLMGMKANPSPRVQGARDSPKSPGYFSAVPPTDYEDDDMELGPMPGSKYSPLEVSHHGQSKPHASEIQQQMRTTERQLSNDDLAGNCSLRLRRQDELTQSDQTHLTDQNTVRIRQNELLDQEQYLQDKFHRTEHTQDHLTDTNVDDITENVVTIINPKERDKDLTDHNVRGHYSNTVFDNNTDSTGKPTNTNAQCNHPDQSEPNVEDEIQSSQAHACTAASRSSSTVLRRVQEENRRFFAYDRNNPPKRSPGGRNRKQFYSPSKPNSKEKSADRKDSNDVNLSPCRVENTRKSKESFEFGEGTLPQISPSTISVDTLPVNPAFPILARVPGFRCRQEGAIMMHYSPCDGYTCREGGPTAVMMATQV